MAERKNVLIRLDPKVYDALARWARDEVRSTTAQIELLLRESLSTLEQELDPEIFVRIHRSALVNVAHVRELQRSAEGRYTVVLHDGTRLRVSERRRAAVLKALGAKGAP